MKELQRSKGLDTATKYARNLAKGLKFTGKAVGITANLLLNPFSKVGLVYKGGKFAYKGAGLLGGAKQVVQGGRAIGNLPNLLQGIKNTQAYKKAETGRLKDMYQSSSFKTAARDIQKNIPSKFTSSGTDLKGLPLINKQKSVVIDAIKQSNKALLKERQAYTQIGRGIGSGVKTGIHAQGLIKGYSLMSGPQSSVTKDSDALEKRRKKAQEFNDKEYNRLLNIK